MILLQLLHLTFGSRSSCERVPNDRCAALAIFCLVLIGTAEYIGFEWGYLAAASATALLVGSCVGTITRSPARGAQLFAMIAIIYGLLYLLLQVEDYALLIGSLAAFAILAAIIFATRNVDWSQGSEFTAPGERLPDAGRR